MKMAKKARKKAAGAPKEKTRRKSARDPSLPSSKDTPKENTQSQRRQKPDTTQRKKRKRRKKRGLQGFFESLNPENAENQERESEKQTEAEEDEKIWTILRGNTEAMSLWTESLNLEVSISVDYLEMVVRSTKIFSRAVIIFSFSFYCFDGGFERLSRKCPASSSTHVSKFACVVMLDEQEKRQVLDITVGEVTDVSLPFSSMRALMEGMRGRCRLGIFWAFHLCVSLISFSCVHLSSRSCGALDCLINTAPKK